MPSSKDEVPDGSSRVKHTRSRSPVVSTSTQPNSENRPPTKRARKAINCEPCRNSKLKCDRNRPCSSCILRGTTALCYQGQEHDPATQISDQQQTRIDPTAEFNRIRLSLSLLESYVHQSHPQRPPQAPPPLPPSQPPTRVASRQEQDSKDGIEINGSAPSTKQKIIPVSTPAPGMLGHQASGGFYSGPTSAISHLMTVPDGEEGESSDGQPTYNYPDTGYGPATSPTVSTPTSAPDAPYDKDLVSKLPPIHIIDGLIEFYFEYCNWIYRHVTPSTFLAGWTRFKHGENGDRLILGTVSLLIALTVRYLPEGHALLVSLNGSLEEIGFKYYNVMLDALGRYHDSCRRDGRGKEYNLDLVELLLLRSHYLTFAKEDPEEIWAVRGELMSIGTALGLHRDPGTNKFDPHVAERRRWAWWYIMVLERWQGFMFGRPVAISSRHYNTRFPTYCDSTPDPTGRLFQPNVSLFKLAHVVGEVMEDAVSFRPVSYSAIQEHDQRLAHWLENIPRELDLDEYQLARSLASPVTSIRRYAVQSVIIRTAFHHIRFTLHRPYAHIPDSLKTAVSAASQLINLVGQTRPDFLSNTALAVPGHIHWGPFHVFSAAMFFSFQLISHPETTTKLFRENVNKAIICLEQSRSMPIADKALAILQALAPLYSDELLSEPLEERERKKASVLKIVKTLAFPYQDAPHPRIADMDAGKPVNTPTAPQYPYDAPAPHQHSSHSSHPRHTHTQIPVSSMRWAPPQQDTNNLPLFSPSETHQRQPAIQNVPHQPTSSPALSYPNGAYTGYVHHQHAHNGVEVVTQSGLPPGDDDGMWGASMGFGVTEWARFLDVMQPQRPDSRIR